MEENNFSEELANQDKTNEEENEGTQVSPNIITFTQLYSIETIKNKISNGSLSIPDFQRKGNLWSSKNKSLFIESILIGLPIPSIVVYSDGTGKLKVIDGLQRISTLDSYLQDKFELSGLSQSTTEELNGLKYCDLDEHSRNKILNSTLSVITVQCSPDDERADSTYYEIFRRLNQGGLILTPQEIRNALYKGQFLAIIRGDLSFKVEEKDSIRENEIWKRFYAVRGNDIHNRARERDVELLLRIFALSEATEDDIKKSLGDFLNTYLKSANKKSKDEIQLMKDAFDKAMVYIEENNILDLFKKNKIRQLMWYNMLISTLIKFFISNKTELGYKDFESFIKSKELPDSSSDTWNSRKIKKWQEIFSEFILK